MSVFSDSPASLAHTSQAALRTGRWVSAASCRPACGPACTPRAPRSFFAVRDDARSDVIEHELLQIFPRWFFPPKPYVGWSRQTCAWMWLKREAQPHGCS